jgi:hypothetical protein
VIAFDCDFVNESFEMRTETEKNRELIVASPQIVLEKRLGIAQLCLLLAILVFLSVTRGSPGDFHPPRVHSKAELYARMGLTHSEAQPRSGFLRTPPRKQRPTLDIKYLKSTSGTCACRPSANAGA